MNLDELVTVIGEKCYGIYCRLCSEQISEEDGIWDNLCLTCDRKTGFCPILSLNGDDTYNREYMRCEYIHDNLNPKEKLIVRWFQIMGYDKAVNPDLTTFYSSEHREKSVHHNFDASHLTIDIKNSEWIDGIKEFINKPSNNKRCPNICDKFTFIFNEHISPQRLIILAYNKFD